MSGQAAEPPPVERLFTAAVALYCAHPFIAAYPWLTREYLLAASRANRYLDALAVATDPADRRRLAELAHEQLCRLRPLSRDVERRTDRFLEALRPIAVPSAET
jgi:hypothetical protein